jgi:aryl-alcohol dehydrogenase-like predicted oxidoreductase
MPLSIQGRPDEGNALRVIHAALEIGVNLIDTADSYCLDDSDFNHNEKLIAKALCEWSGSKSEVHVATKGGLKRPGGDWITDARPGRLKQACESSLSALGVDSIFLYQFHAPDPQVPFQENIQELEDLRKEGKIQNIGLSNVSLEQLKTALKISPIQSVQNRCNAYDKRDFQNGLYTFCEENHVSYIAYSPVGGHYRHRYLAQEKTLTAIGKAHGASAYQTVLAWLLAKGKAMIAIPGASRVDSIRSSAESAGIKLSADEVKKIDAIHEPKR